VILPERAGRQRDSRRLEINQARIPHRNEPILHSRLNVHCCRSRLGIADHWDLVHGQHMMAGWQPGTIGVTLRDVRHRPAVDLEIEREVPSEVRRPVHDQVTGRMTRVEVTRRGTCLRDSADADRARKSKNEKNDAGEAVSWFHSIHYTCELRFDQNNEPAIFEVF
jgi:hypothetical protein